MTTIKIILTPTTKEPKICHTLATTSAFNLKLCHYSVTKSFEGLLLRVLLGGLLRVLLAVLLGVLTGVLLGVLLPTSCPRC